MKEKIRFILLSLIGIVIFFIPVSNSKVPVVLFVDFFKEILGNNLRVISIISVCFYMVTLLMAYLLKNRYATYYLLNDSIFKKVLNIFSFIVVVLIVLDVKLPFIQHPEIGQKILNLASTIFLTIMIAGSLVIFIIRSGIVQFISVLMEPIMRPIFKLPGEAAMNVISSFVSSASVGVYFTEQFYKREIYTTKEACVVVSSFSVISVGYIGVLAQLANIEHMYGVLIIISFLLVLFMAIIMVRIPPLSLKGDTTISGHKPISNMKKMGLLERLNTALDCGASVSNEFTLEAFKQNMIQSLMFASKTIGVMIIVVTTVLTMVYFTQFFQIIGRPIGYFLQLFRLPNAFDIAPSVLIGIVEVSLPSILITGKIIAEQSAFFVVLLSIVQIIFFSEAGNAILSSKLPISFLDLILIFIVRTLVAIPIVALISHLIY